MAYEGYLEFNGTEIVNVARTGALAVSLGLGQVHVNEDRAAVLQSRVRGIEAKPGSVHYRDIALAPWYDDGYAASHEFAGLMPLSVQGLDDSTLQADVTEYITDGGHSAHSRNTTLSIVISAVLLAATERGAEYGLRWLNRTLRGQTNLMESGFSLDYLRHLSPDSPWANRRKVNVTRSPVIARKRTGQCFHAWTINFTLTADDPYEYGRPETLFANLGKPVIGGTPNQGVISNAVEVGCPTYDYSPLYDPLYPALVASPTAPQFLPQGWTLGEGTIYRRHWARVAPLEPSETTSVPIIKFTSTEEARMVRLSILPSGADPADTCAAIFTVILTYLPPDTPIYVDGVRKAVYAWDGFSPTVRRCDTLAYGTDGKPVTWTAFGDATDFTLALDTLQVASGVYEGGGNVRASVEMVSKSD